MPSRQRRPWVRALATALILPTILSTTPVWALPTNATDDLRGYETRDGAAGAHLNQALGADADPRSPQDDPRKIPPAGSVPSVFTHLSNPSSPRTPAWLSAQQIAEALGLRPRTVETDLVDLVRMGLLRTAGRGTQRVYQLAPFLRVEHDWVRGAMQTFLRRSFPTARGTAQERADYRHEALRQIQGTLSMQPVRREDIALLTNTHPLAHQGQPFEMLEKPAQPELGDKVEVRYSSEVQDASGTVMPTVSYATGATTKPRAILQAILAAPDVPEHVKREALILARLTGTDVQAPQAVLASLRATHPELADLSRPLRRNAYASLQGMTAPRGTPAEDERAALRRLRINESINVTGNAPRDLASIAESRAVRFTPPLWPIVQHPDGTLEWFDSADADPWHQHVSPGDVVHLAIGDDALERALAERRGTPATAQTVREEPQGPRGSPLEVFKKLIGVENPEAWVSVDEVRGAYQAAGEVSPAASTIRRDVTPLVALGIVERQGRGDKARFRATPLARHRQRALLPLLGRLGYHASAREAQASIGNEVARVLHPTYNFAPGQTELPDEVVAALADDVREFSARGTGALEIYHKDPAFLERQRAATANLRALLDIPEDFEILFLGGGASEEYGSVPYQLLPQDGTADYVNTGVWASRAIAAAQVQAQTVGAHVRVVATSESDGFRSVPVLTPRDFDPHAAYVYMVHNNTAAGTRMALPDTGDVPLVVDMTSSFLSEPMRPADWRKIGMVFAGLQKNLGPAGSRVVVIRKSLLERVQPRHAGFPAASYVMQAQAESHWNTPNVLGVLSVYYMTEWIRRQGGVEEMHRRAQARSSRLYDFLDASQLFSPRVQPGPARSLMNITFELPNDELTARCLKEAEGRGLLFLKGFPSMGGLRASVYIGMTDEGVDTLLAFMRDFESRHLDERRAQQLRAIAQRMAPLDGGILAADESTGTAGKRLALVGLENTPQHREAMRRVLLTTPTLHDAGISAVILDRDTLTNRTPDGSKTLVQHLLDEGIIPGLKTDEGLKDIPEAERATLEYPYIAGMKQHRDPELTKLPDLLATADRLGLKFTKFRSTIPVGAPEAYLRSVARIQARQAKMAQEAGLVPIVEPEVIHDASDGSASDHTLGAAYVTITRVQVLVFEELVAAGVQLDGMILKPSMIATGKKAMVQSEPDEVGFATLKGLLVSVPAEVPANVFLSGGMARATEYLDAVNRAAQARFTEARDEAVTELRAEGKTERADEVAALTQTPWGLSFSFGRELQGKALVAWGGQDANIPAAQVAKLNQAREVQAARQGRLQEAQPRAPPLVLAAALANAQLTTVARQPSQAVPAAGKEQTTAIAAGILHLVGDQQIPKGDKDAFAEEIGDAYNYKRGIRDHVYLVEGEIDVEMGELGADQTHVAGQLVNRNGLGDSVYSGNDRIEVTNGAHTGRNRASRDLDTMNPGSTSLRAEGEAVRVHGIVPESYALLVAASVPHEKMSAYDEQPLNVLFDVGDPRAELEAMLQRLASDNGVSLNELEIAIMGKVETERTEDLSLWHALQDIQRAHARDDATMTITPVPDGSVDPTRLALARRKEGKVLVALMKAKSTEATTNYFESGALGLDQTSAYSPVFSMAYVSENTKYACDEDGTITTDAQGKKIRALNHANRLRWSERERRGIARRHDGKAILSGEQLFTQKTARELVARHDVELSATVLTDNPWFNLPRPHVLADGDTVRTHTIRVSSVAAQRGERPLWVETDDVSRHAVLKTVAQKRFRLDHPTAAAADVVDRDGDTVALARRAEPTTVLIHEDSLFGVDGDGAVALDELFAHLKVQLGVASVAEAAKRGLRLHVLMKPTIGATGDRSEERALQDRLDRLIRAANEATTVTLPGHITAQAAELDPAWFTPVTTKPKRVHAVIAPTAEDARQLSDEHTLGAFIVAMPEQDAETRSVSSALYGAVATVARQERQLSPATRERLGLAVDASGFLVPQAKVIDEQRRERLKHYRATMGAV